MTVCVSLVSALESHPLGNRAIELASSLGNILASTFVNKLLVDALVLVAELATAKLRNAPEQFVLWAMVWQLLNFLAESFPLEQRFVQPLASLESIMPKPGQDIIQAMKAPEEICVAKGQFHLTKGFGAIKVSSLGFLIFDLGFEAIYLLGKDDVNISRATMSVGGQLVIRDVQGSERHVDGLESSSLRWWLSY